MDSALEDPSSIPPVEEDLLLHLPFEERVDSKVPTCFHVDSGKYDVYYAIELESPCKSI
jgi:hypothetical protein